MKLLFEKSTKGHHCTLLPELDVPACEPAKADRREAELSLPEPEGGSGPSVLVLTLVDIFANECRCLLPVPQRP